MTVDCLTHEAYFIQPKVLRKTSDFHCFTFTTDTGSEISLRQVGLAFAWILFWSLHSLVCYCRGGMWLKRVGTASFRGVSVWPSTSKLFRYSVEVNKLCYTNWRFLLAQNARKPLCLFRDIGWHEVTHHTCRNVEDRFYQQLILISFIIRQVLPASYRRQLFIFPCWEAS